MRNNTLNNQFAKLFKKYRLQSEIETLTEFGNIFAENGFVYENSIFTKWQNGSRVPKDRRTIIGIATVFIQKGGICLVSEVNRFLEAANQGLLTSSEIKNLPKISEKHSSIQFQDVGSILKMNRLQKHVSKIEMALALQFPNEDYIEDIENGKNEFVDRNTIKKYCQILGLQDQEVNNILLAGNYLPSKNEIISIQNSIGPVLEAYQYSAVLYDFCWRVIFINGKHAKILELNKSDLDNLHEINPPAIEILFNKNFKQNKILTGVNKEIWHNNLLRFIIHFRSLQRSITNSTWYINLIKKMTSNSLFRKIWNDSEQKKGNFITTRKGYKVFKVDDRILKYHIYIVPLYSDPRFEIEYYSPADLATLKYLQTE